MTHALVLGASQGIGRAAALAIAKQGRSVTVAARDLDALTALCAELKAAGAADAWPLALDLDSREDAVERIARHTTKVGAVDVLVLNAGGPAGGPLLDAGIDAFEVAFNRHLFAFHRIVQTVLPGMRAAGFGRIVYVSSTSVREPIPGLGISNTLRAAMAGWAKTLSRELPPGITINTVLPGFTDTDRLGQLASSRSTADQSADAIKKAWAAASPEGRLGRPEELGAAIAFLTSDEASFVRGVVLPVDGGRLHSI